jgi:hypothetical protein
MKKRSVEIGDALMSRLARARLSPQEDEVRTSILKTFAKDGKAPDVGAIADALGLFAPDAVPRLCTPPSASGAPRGNRAFISEVAEIASSCLIHEGSLYRS